MAPTSERMKDLLDIIPNEVTNDLNPHLDTYQLHESIIPSIPSSMIHGDMSKLEYTNQGNQEKKATKDLEEVEGTLDSITLNPIQVLSSKIHDNDCTTLSLIDDCLLTIHNASINKEYMREHVQVDSSSQLSSSILATNTTTKPKYYEKVENRNKTDRKYDSKEHERKQYSTGGIQHDKDDRLMIAAMKRLHLQNKNVLENIPPHEKTRNSEPVNNDSSKSVPKLSNGSSNDLTYSAMNKTQSEKLQGLNQKTQEHEAKGGRGIHVHSKQKLKDLRNQNSFHTNKHEWLKMDDHDLSLSHPKCLNESQTKHINFVTYACLQAFMNEIKDFEHNCNMMQDQHLVKFANFLNEKYIEKSLDLLLPTDNKLLHQVRNLILMFIDKCGKNERMDFSKIVVLFDRYQSSLNHSNLDTNNLATDINKEDGDHLWTCQLCGKINDGNNVESKRRCEVCSRKKGYNMTKDSKRDISRRKVQQELHLNKTMRWNALPLEEQKCRHLLRCKSELEIEYRKDLANDINDVLEIVRGALQKS